MDKTLEESARFSEKVIFPASSNVIDKIIKEEKKLENTQKEITELLKGLKEKKVELMGLGFGFYIIVFENGLDAVDSRLQYLKKLKQISNFDYSITRLEEDVNSIKQQVDLERIQEAKTVLVNVQAYCLGIEQDAKAMRAEHGDVLNNLVYLSEIYKEFCKNTGMYLNALEVNDMENAGHYAKKIARSSMDVYRFDWEQELSRFYHNVLLPIDEKSEEFRKTAEVLYNESTSLGLIGLL
ncbi:MAG: hypothetical protein KAS39_00265 [Actinomycetia bacterium]|nr:hypothetical protein [Actinomycetes bacterium]